MGWVLETRRIRIPSNLEECTPPDVHLCQVCLIGGLHDQLIHLSIDRKSNGLLRHKASELVTNIFQNPGWRIRNIDMGTALWKEKP